jgi:two-component system CheB/CheR fusion protein
MTDLLPAAEDLLRVVVEEAPDYAFIILDRSGCIQRWNRGAELLFGAPAEDMIGRHFSALFTIEDVSIGAPETELQKACDDGKTPDRRWHARRDGTRFFADGVTTALKEGAEVIGFVKLARDATALKRAEEDNQRLLVREQQLNREKDDFLAAVSHELRTPLTTMKGWLALIEENPENLEIVRQGGTAARQSADMLAKLVDDLLDNVRVRTGKMRVAPRPMDLAVITEDSIQAFRLAYEAKKLTVRQDLAREVLILADSTRVHQIIANVLSNSIRHNPVGGSIDVTLRTEDGHAVLEVRDTGEGIEPSMLSRIFEPFWQHRGAKNGGLGLGLAIARSLVEMHGGTIGAESDGPGCGATFRIRLPVLSR